VANDAPITLEQLFRFNRGLPHQLAAITELETDLAANGYTAAMRRDRPWFATWSQAGKQDDLGPALQLIKEFEGCRLSAYPDPASGGEPWTIGYGSTRYQDGRKVSRGDTITSAQAEQLLAHEVERTVAKLAGTVPHWREMSGPQRCALVSFAYNLGSEFYGAEGFETISARLRDQAWQQVPDAMLLYRNPGTSVESGLRRRRAAEGSLWLSGAVRSLPVQQQQGQATGRFTPGSPFDYQVSRHITYGEFALQHEDRRFIAQHQCDTARELAQFLERARVEFGGKPIIITSGYRPAAVNRAVGGASQSEHLYDAPDTGAVDFYIEGTDVYAVQRWCDHAWPYSVGYGAPKGFVHLGVRPGRPRVRWVY
jgi:hypothetical protein